MGIFGISKFLPSNLAHFYNVYSGAGWQYLRKKIKKIKILKKHFLDLILAKKTIYQLKSTIWSSFGQQKYHVKNHEKLTKLTWYDLKTGNCQFFELHISPKFEWLFPKINRRVYQYHIYLYFKFERF